MISESSEKPVNRNLLPIISLVDGETRDPRVNCTNCTGACCRVGSVLLLADRERDALTDAGTVLERVGPGEIRRKFLGFVAREATERYRMVTDCGNFDPATGGCKVFGSAAERPLACYDFRAGSQACIMIQGARIKSGQDAHEPGVGEGSGPKTPTALPKWLNG